MRRIDMVKNKKMKNIKHALVLDQNRIKVVFNNGHEIILKSSPIDFGYDSAIYIEKE